MNITILPKRLPDVEIQEITYLQELNTMLSKRIDDWTVPWKSEGRAEGQSWLLLRLLEEKFGPLAADIQNFLSLGYDEHAVLRMRQTYLYRKQCSRGSWQPITVVSFTKSQRFSKANEMNKLNKPKNSIKINHPTIHYPLFTHPLDT